MDGLENASPLTPWRSGDSGVEAPSDLFKFGLSTEDQHKPEISGDFKIVGPDNGHDLMAEGLLALGGGHWWWLVTL